jgi:serine/threonine protein kinase
MNPRESEFEKKKKLGAGSFGIAHLVQRRKDGAQFALKEICLRKQINLQQAMKEVDTMRMLPPHRNIVRLHDNWLSADKKDMWLLLEYCSEGNMSQFLMASVSLPEDAVLDLCVQLLQALSVLEQHHVVHNDIKPDNIFIMQGSVPKIGDLGLARFTSTGSVLSKTPGGTPLFQAPEALSKTLGGDGGPLCFSEYAAHDVSYQSDVYSLGVVMWSLIMRRYPDRPGGASMLTAAVVKNSKLLKLVNEMLQPDSTKRPRASHLCLGLTPVVSPPPDRPDSAIRPRVSRASKTHSFDEIAIALAPELAAAASATSSLKLSVLSRNDSEPSTKLRTTPQDVYTNFAFQNTDDADVPNGTAVRVLSDSGSFSRVQLPSGRQGWAKTAYLKPSSAPLEAASFSAPASAPAPAPAPAQEHESAPRTILKLLLCILICVACSLFCLIPKTETGTGFGIAFTVVIAICCGGLLHFQKIMRKKIMCMALVYAPWIFVCLMARTDLGNIFGYFAIAFITIFCAYLLKHREQ